MANSFQSLAGRLLVSHPSLRDDNFRETVVLIYSHDEASGAMGVIMNRPFGRLLGHAQKEFSDTPLAGVPLHLAGPVATDKMAFGGWKFSARGPAAIRYGIGQDEAAVLAQAGQFKLFAFVGYAGWSPGQLENELRLNAWIICPFERGFEEFEGEELWKRLLMHHCPELRLEFDSPENPGLN